MKLVVKYTVGYFMNINNHRVRKHRLWDCVGVGLQH